MCLPDWFFQLLGEDDCKFQKGNLFQSKKAGDRLFASLSVSVTFISVAHSVGQGGMHQKRTRPGPGRLEKVTAFRSRGGLPGPDLWR
jgi:hypothetical protein